MNQGRHPDGVGPGDRDAAAAPPKEVRGSWPLRHRRLRPELMDQPDLDPVLHLHALAGLQRINVLSRSAAILWPEIAAVARRMAPAKLTVLDVASGGGDNAIALARLAKRHGLCIAVSGCDVSNVAVEESRKRARAAGADVSFFQRDVLAEPLPEGYHVVTCSLFLHHLSEPDALALLKQMAAAAGELVLISDLRRTWLGYALAWIGGRVFTRSPIVRVDGPRSVAGAFTSSEARSLACRSGLAAATITHHWPQRWRLAWKKR